MKIFNHKRVPSVLHEPSFDILPVVRDGSSGSWLILRIFLCDGKFHRVHTEEE